MLRLLFCIVKTCFWGRPDQAERRSGRYDCFVLAMGTDGRLTQINVGIRPLVFLEQIPNPKISHRMMIRLLRNVFFDNAKCSSTDTSDCVVSLEGLWLCSFQTGLHRHEADGGLFAVCLCLIVAKPGGSTDASGLWI